MKKMRDENCPLILEKLFFDEIKFQRKNIEKSGSDPCFSFQIRVGKKEDEDLYIATIISYVEKEDEYDIEISLSGLFLIDADMQIENEDIEQLINKNAVAILMPYMRSEISLITAQPDVECITMPPININAMMERE